MARQGGGNLQQQIARLESKVGVSGKREAKEILAEYEPDVIALAFKMCPKMQTGLGKATEALIANLPVSKQEETRAALLKAKEKLATT